MTKEYPSTKSEKRIFFLAIKQGLWSLGLLSDLGPASGKGRNSSFA